MSKYYILEILETQAFDVIIAVLCIIPFYFLMKWHLSIKFKELRDNVVEDIFQYLDENR
tara:strand:- start:4533 stop:4709 length:177 start_codon:yes stop_codon:yes gene_type:complete